MARSMTAYGVGKAGDTNLSIVAEARSVNNRFLDLSLRLPRELYALEGDIRDLVRKRIERGRVTLTITEEWVGESGGGLRIDKAKALRYHSLLQELQELTGVKGDIRLDHLLNAGDVFISQDDDDANRTIWALTKQAVEDALNDFDACGRREGDLLAKDMLERLAGIREGLAQIKVLAASQATEYRKRLTARLEEMLADTRLDRNRLETEIAISADRLDISEEIVRLGSHIELYQSTLARSGAIGKTLGFALQEMGREVNTMASKSWMVEIAQIAVGMKETLEQLREQVQNIE